MRIVVSMNRIHRPVVARTSMLKVSVHWKFPRKKIATKQEKITGTDWIIFPAVLIYRYKC